MIKRSGHTLRVATVFIILLLPAAVFGQYDYIDINNPFSRKIPMAIPAFAALNSDGTDPALFKKATEILTNSLDFTGFFNMMASMQNGMSHTEVTKSTYLLNFSPGLATMSAMA